MRKLAIALAFTAALAACKKTGEGEDQVEKPVVGRLLNYGHFVFESAAQEQGLRDIRYVGRPYERDLVIPRVVQRAGLRGPRVIN